MQGVLAQWLSSVLGIGCAAPNLVVFEVRRLSRANLEKTAGYSGEPLREAAAVRCRALDRRNRGERCSCFSGRGGGERAFGGDGKGREDSEVRERVRLRRQGAPGWC
jgi:hypothetical protein